MPDTITISAQDFEDTCLAMHHMLETIKRQHQEILHLRKTHARRFRPFLGAGVGPLARAL